MPRTVTAEFTAKGRLRNRSRRSSGASERRSTAMNSIRKIAATMNPEITSRSDHPLVAALITANSRANRAMAIVIWPGQSSERPSGAEEFCAVQATPALIRARMPTATKAHRQAA